jgi:hypothetical protein
MPLSGQCEAVKSNRRENWPNVPDPLFNEVLMCSNHPTLREVAICLDLLRPSDAREKCAAHQKCSIYLQRRVCFGGRFQSVLDRQLAIAILERWLAL